MSSQPEPPSDPTFRRYTSAQAAAYAHGRGTYPPALYDLILSHHIQTGGKTTTLLDIGTGPGTALRSLALSFTHAHGLDPSPAMISTARSLGGSTASGAPIRFDVSTAEELGANVAGIEDGTVDMITAATAAHVSNILGVNVLGAGVPRHVSAANITPKIPSGSTCLLSGDARRSC